jgi:hypothetical protein
MSDQSEQIHCDRLGPAPRVEQGGKDMNLNDNPTIEQFHDLLGQQDDHAGHHVLWVRKDGEVIVTRLPKSSPRRTLPPYDDPEMQMRYDTFPVGYGYVGPKPLEDLWFTGELFGDMLRRWAAVQGTPGITHIDLDTIAPYGRPMNEEEALQIARYGRK